MVNDVLKKKIIDKIGKQYSIEIINQLNKEKIKPKKATAFTPGLIRQIVNGQYENKVIEDVIIKLLFIKKSEDLKREKLIEKI